jgi:hypothetical protein
MDDETLLPELKFLPGQRVMLLGVPGFFRVVWCENGFVGAEHCEVINEREVRTFMVRPHTFWQAAQKYGP